MSGHFKISVSFKYAEATSSLAWKPGDVKSCKNRQKSPRLEFLAGRVPEGHVLGLGEAKHLHPL